MQNWQKYAAEVYGTFVLVLFGTGAILATGGDPVGIALGFGLALVAGLYTVGRISGGHFNPAVSLAAFLDKRIELNQMVAYWVAQLSGAVLASLTVAYVSSRDIVAGTRTALSGDVEAFQGFVWEMMLTAVFVMAILVLAKKGTRPRLLGIGLTLTAVHLAGLGITGASVNPARSFGPALVGGEWADIWVYIVGPAVGAILAWVLYKVIIMGDLDFTVGTGQSAAAAAPVKATRPAKPATTARKPATTAKKPATKKPAPKRSAHSVRVSCGAPLRAPHPRPGSGEVAQRQDDHCHQGDEDQHRDPQHVDPLALAMARTRPAHHQDHPDDPGSGERPELRRGLVTDPVGDQPGEEAEGEPGGGAEDQVVDDGEERAVGGRCGHGVLDAPDWLRVSPIERAVRGWLARWHRSSRPGRPGRSFRSRSPGWPRGWRCQRARSSRAPEPGDR